MKRQTGGATLLVPEPGRAASTARPGSYGLPRDLARQATQRLRAMAVMYAVVFFLAAFVPRLTSQAGRTMLVSNVAHWLPGTLAIAFALLVAAIVATPTLQRWAAAALAIAFEVASSYGIAAAELLQPHGGLEFGNANWIGLSWVGVWTLLYTIVVPAPPKRSVLAALGASSSVPVMAAVSLRLYPPSRIPDAEQFFFAFVFPYLLIVGMAYVGSRVFFALGHEVKKARELGAYRLLERLGQGGMGEVWRARHRLLARPAAIKLIRQNVTDAGAGSEVASRFEREAQAIASLRSPHTVDLFDFGVADDGTFYYVMELLEGLDAERMVNRYGPMPDGRVIHVISQVCHSLSEAESVSLVHRDVKPANIFLCRYGEDYDFVKVLDFGIVKAIRQPAAADAETMLALTADHVVRGTPAFIAPEQALDETSVDHRADIYGIGCVAYWLLTGELVFDADTPMQLILKHAHETPDAPSSRTELPVSNELDAIVLECLAKSPSGRPQSARELARRLQAVPVKTPWTPELARAWWETHRPVPDPAPSEVDG
jgi:serine/threonine-protein kinase